MNKILDNDEQNRKNCKFYQKHGICSHADVSGQNKRCLGTVKCGVYEKHLNWNETIQLMAKLNKKGIINEKFNA